MIFSLIFLVMGAQVIGTVFAWDSLQEIEETFWNWRLRDSPEFASSVGVTAYNDLLTSYNMSTFETRKAAIEGFLNRLNAQDFSTLDVVQQRNYMLLRDRFEVFLEGYQWRFYEPLNPMSFLDGIQTSPAHFLEDLPFQTLLDYNNYIARLIHLPQQLKEIRIRLNEAIDTGHTLHKVSVDRVPAQITKLLVKNVTESIFYKPFGDPLDKSNVPLSKRSEIRHDAQEVLGNVISEFRVLRDFIETTYLAHTRPTWGIHGWTHGRENYKACLNWHLSLDLTPEHVHALGLQEVARIRLKMEQTLERLDFNGSITDFFNMVRNDQRFHIKSEKDLLKRYNDIIHNDIFPKLPQLFKDIPDLPLRVSPMPFDGVGGEYISGTVDGTRPGIFYVNLFHPNEIATIDMKPLSLHETIPGHHLQAIYTLAADLPAHQKFHEDNNHWQVPFKFPFYTAYLEGWALYAEYLGEEMGLYKDDYELMGRYGSEMFRACRLVVDTGLHYFNWSEEEAVTYMLSNTAYSRNDIISEIHRYLTWPGQACAYKIGEMKIRELRQEAEDTLGPLFDVREFHSVLLKNGPVSLTILEKLVKDWVEETMVVFY